MGHSLDEVADGGHYRADNPTRWSVVRRAESVVLSTLNVRLEWSHLTAPGRRLAERVVREGQRGFYPRFRGVEATLADGSDLL